MPEPSPIIQVTKSAIKAYMAGKLLACGASGAYPTLAGANVSVDNYGPVQANQCPAIRIYATQETSEYLDYTQDRRNVEIRMELYAAGEDAGVQIDLIDDTIVNIFRNDEYLGGDWRGLVEWCRYKSGDPNYDEKRHFDGLSRGITFDVRYLWESVPDGRVARIAPFVTMDANYTFAEGDPQAPIVVPTLTDYVAIPQV